MVDSNVIAKAVYALYRPGRDKLKQVTETEFTPDVVLASPWLEAHGKEDLYNITRLWEILFDDKVDVRNVAVEKDTAVVYDIHKITPRFFPFFELQLPYNTILNFKNGRIGAIQDHPSLYGITWNVPILGYLWERYLKQVVGIGGSFAGAGLDMALEQIKNMFDWKDLDI